MALVAASGLLLGRSTLWSYLPAFAVAVHGSPAGMNVALPGVVVVSSAGPGVGLMQGAGEVPSTGVVALTFDYAAPTLRELCA